MELLANLGIDYRLLIAQLVNFAILLAVLYKFLYKPVLKLLQERSVKIETGLKNAEAADVKFKEAAAMYETKVREVRGETAKMMEAAKAETAVLRAKLTADAQQEAEKIMESARNRLIVEKEKIMKEAEHELADLVAHATEHVLGNMVTLEIDKHLIDEAVKKVRVGRA